MHRRSRLPSRWHGYMKVKQNFVLVCHEKGSEAIERGYTFTADPPHNTGSSTQDEWLLTVTKGIPWGRFWMALSS